MNLKSDFVEKLRNSGLRPTEQRLKVCDALFNTNKTFHFTISDLSKIISSKVIEKISLATIYNTVHTFEKKGYLKEITINSNQSYFDTNISHHHHFFDESKKELIDLKNEDIEPIKIKKTISGKKIKSVEILVRVESNN